jgi:hypothetical protein
MVLPCRRADVTTGVRHRAYGKRMKGKGKRLIDAGKQIKNAEQRAEALARFGASSGAGQKKTAHHGRSSGKEKVSPWIISGGAGG